MHSRHKSSFRGMTCAILRPSGPCFHDWRGIPMPWQGPWHCWYSELRWQNLHWWTWNGIPFAQTGPCFQVWWWWWWGGCGRFGKSWLIIGLFFFFWGGGCSLFDPKNVPIVSHNIAGQVHSKVGCLFFLSLKSPSVLPCSTHGYKVLKC